jgi:hypothetical protein
MKVFQLHMFIAPNEVERYSEMSKPDLEGDGHNVFKSVFYLTPLSAAQTK